MLRIDLGLDDKGSGYSSGKYFSLFAKELVLSLFESLFFVILHHYYTIVHIKNQRVGEMYSAPHYQKNHKILLKLFRQIAIIVYAFLMREIRVC